MSAQVTLLTLFITCGDRVFQKVGPTIKVTRLFFADSSVSNKV